MSYNHPVISTPVGGIPEVIASGKNGILVHPGKTQEIADAIKYYIENPNKISEHGEYAYSVVKDYFPQKVFSDLERIYQQSLLTM